MASAAFTPGPTYTNGDSMKYETTGKYCTRLKIGGRVYKKDFIDAPGVNGCGTKNFGFREQPVEITVCYVNTSEANVLAAFESDMSSVGSGPCTLVAGGQTFQGCDVRFGTLEQVKSTGGGKYHASVTIEANRKRLS